MKEVKKEIALAKIEAILEVLGFSKKDMETFMSTIETKITKSKTNSKQLKKKGSKSEKKETGMDSIISALENNPSEMYDIERISSESGISLRTARTYIKQLRDSKKVKVVGCNLTSHGPATLLYQGYRSPLKALKIVTPDEGYDSISSFVKNNKNLLCKSIMPSSFAYVVEQEGLTVYPMLLSMGIVKGYKTTELKKLAKRVYGSSEEKPKRKYTKKATKPKRKYTKRSKIEPIEVQEQPTTGKLNIFRNLFKKKQKTSELIKF